MSLIWIPFAAAGLLFVVPAAAVVWVALRSMRPHPPSPPPDLEWGAIHREAVTVPSGHRALPGWLVAPEGDARGIVLLVHGWGSDAENTLAWSRFLAEKGWASLAFTLRSHGAAAGTEAIGLPLLAEDVLAAGVFLDGHPVWSAAPRAVLGHSMGGGAVLLALSRGLEARAAVISSGFARVETLTNIVLRRHGIPPRLFGWIVKLVWRLRLGVDPDSVEPEGTIRGLTLPILLTHGTEDAVVSHRELARLQQAAPKQFTEVLEVLGAGHSDVVNEPAYRAGITVFLERALSRVHV